MNDLRKKLSELAAKMPPSGKALNAHIAKKRMIEGAKERHDRKRNGGHRTSESERSSFYERMKN